MSKKQEILSKKDRMFFIILIFMFSFISFRKAFAFDFWRDDWQQLWAATYHSAEFISDSPAVRLHPISALEQYLLVKLLGFNPLLWQIWGYLLKVIDSIFISIMVFALTRSKRAAFFSGLFFSVYLGGMESVTWVSAHTSALIIPLLCIGFYFWINSEKENSSRPFILALAIFLLTIIGDPARAMGIIILAIFWDTMSIVGKISKESIKKITIRMASLGLLYLISKPLLDRIDFPSISEIVSITYKDLSKDPLLIKTIFYSLGNLLIGWIVKLQDMGGLSSANKISIRVSLIFLIIIIINAIYFLRKKKRITKAVLFLSFWLLLFYIPNWLFDKTLVVGTSHRYVSLAAPTVAGIFAILIASIKNRAFSGAILAVVILININTTNRILKQEWNFRSTKVVEALWDKVDSDVPQGEKGSIFMYTGGDYLTGVAMGWSFSAPFGIRRGYTQADDFPIVTGDRDLISKLICEGNVMRPSLGKWSIQAAKIPLSHLHAWEIQNGVLVNVTDREKSLLIKEYPCIKSLN